LIFLKYRERKHKLTLYLFIIFSCYLLAIIFSWLSKVLVLYSGIEYLQEGATSEPRILASYILLRIANFRFSFVFLTIAIYISYILKVNIFDNGIYNELQRIIISIYAVFTAIFSFAAYGLTNVLLDLLAFLFVFVFMLTIYLQFLLAAYKSYKKVTEKPIKTAFTSLMLMSFSFIMILFSFLIDRILIFMGSPGFTVWYFMAWTWGIIGIVGTYYGYIRPGRKRE
ncbi:MAG: hypothetical protein ACOC35_02465, partial [Promethearchaeia archaeon]